VSETEVMAALGKFMKTSETARVAANKVIAVANVDVDRISDGFMALLSWSAKISAILVNEVKSKPELGAKLVEAERAMADNADIIYAAMLKFAPYISSFLVDTGLMNVLLKLLTAVFSV